MEREAIFWFIDLLVLLIILFFILKYISALGESTTFQKKYLAKDMALLVDTMYASPGNIYVNYPQPTFWFVVSFEKNKLAIFENEKQSTTLKGEGSYLEDGNIQFEHYLFKPKERYIKKETFFDKYVPVYELLKSENKGITKNQTLNLTFFKNANELRILNDEVIPTLNTLACDDVRFRIQLLFVTDEETQPLYESLSLFSVGESITREELSNSNGVRDETFFAIIQKPSSFAYVKSYFSAESRSLRSLSCQLINGILSTEFGKHLDAVSSVPSNSVTLRKKANFTLLAPNILILEIGLNSTLSTDEVMQLRPVLYRTLATTGDP